MSVLADLSVALLPALSAGHSVIAASRGLGGRVSHGVYGNLTLSLSPSRRCEPAWPGGKALGW